MCSNSKQGNKNKTKNSLKKSHTFWNLAGTFFLFVLFFCFWNSNNVSNSNLSEDNRTSLSISHIVNTSDQFLMFSFLPPIKNRHYHAVLLIVWVMLRRLLVITLKATQWNGCAFDVWGCLLQSSVLQNDHCVSNQVLCMTL